MNTSLDNNLFVPVSKDHIKNDDVASDATMDNVTHANSIRDSPKIRRIPLKPIEQRPTDELINEKR